MRMAKEKENGMKIQEMFYKRIDRDIKGVIKVGQADEENVFQELDEYVVTSELSRYMNRFFDAYQRSVSRRTDKMGVWISGFFGSGKSHFLKILSYILEDKKVIDEAGKEYTASSFFMDDAKVESKELQKKIARAAKLAGNTDVILFNIDSKSTSDSKMNKEAVKEVFMKVFHDYMGYCGSIPFLAEFEHKLDIEGRYEDFKSKFKEINGSLWVDAREDFYFIQDEIIESVTAIGIMSENEAKNWAENAQNSYSLSIEKFAGRVRKYCERKGADHHVLFLVDEIGQYIADDSKLMVNLQTVAEDLGTACRGKAWVIVTSQQDIDSITKTMGDDFSKIQGRFDTRIALSSANVDEVIRRRILYKGEKAAGMLKNFYGENADTLKHIISFSDGTPHMPLYKDADDFAEVYPFIPYQFKLLGHVLTSVRQYSSSGKHLADGERSMLALFKEAAQKYETEDEGILVPFNAFYSGLDDFIDHTHRIVITQAASNSRLDTFDVELLKVLFMIKHVNNFNGNVENLTTLMISKVTENTLELSRKVEKSLRKLCEEMLVQRNGKNYVFLTNEEQEAENAIRAIHVDPTEIQNYVAQVAFEELLTFPNNKYKVNPRHQFAFNQQIDDRFYRNTQGSTIGLHLLTAYSGQEDEMALSMLSMTEKSVIVRLSDSHSYLSETEEMKKIEAFLNKPDFTNLVDYDVISANKRKERSEKAKRVSDYIKLALETGDIYVGGTKMGTKSRNVTERINNAFAKLIENEYSKLGDMKSEPGQSDILELLRRTKTQMSLDLGDLGDVDQDALNDMIESIRYAGKSGAKFSIKQAFDKYMAAPYGYTEEDIEFLIAKLYKNGQISLKMNSVVYSPAGTSADDAYKYITRREYREKILLEIKAVPQSRWVKAVKDTIRDFFGKTVMTEDTDALMRDFQNYGNMKRTIINDELRAEYGVDCELPGKKILEKAIRLIDETCNVSDPMTFYKRVDALYDDFDEVSEEMVDLNSFLGGAQKEKFKHACRTLGIYERSKNYISDPDIIEYADQIRKIKRATKPYGHIPKMEEYDNLLGKAIVELLEKDAERIKPDVYSDQKIAAEAVDEDRPYAKRIKKEISDKFSELIDKLDHAKDMATLNGIPAESNALLTNFINRINHEEGVYQKSIQPQIPSDSKPETGMGKDMRPSSVRKSKIIRTVPITMRTLTQNRTFTMRSKDDVDKFIEEMRKKLYDNLGEDIVIKLS